MMFWEIFGKIQSYDAAVPEDCLFRTGKTY
jgi:hypothetical protein